MALLGKKAPNFKSNAVINGEEIVNDFSLSDYEGKKYVLFFFYPKDFTFVCPTEILAFQEKLEEFKKRDVEVVGCSTDSEESHWAWLNTPKDHGGIEGVTYPLVADLDKTVSYNYGVLAGDYYQEEDGTLSFEGSPVAYRGLFLLDKQGVVRHELVNDMPLGRNVDEALRMVDALQHFENKGEVCPADWEEGKEAIEETHESVSEYLSKN